MTTQVTLPLPPHFDPSQVVDLRFIDHAGLEQSAIAWRKQHGLVASIKDAARVGLLVIDAQNTFCNPQGELFVAGQPGTGGAVEDSRRLLEFIYRNLGLVSEITCTLDTHWPYAVFHPSSLVDQDGNNPAPFTQVSADDVKSGKWQASPFYASAVAHGSLVAANKQLLHYCQQLEANGRYSLTVWPYHAMLGGVGHALVSGLQEALFFHAIARGAQPEYQVKGTNPWTENYSVLGPEVLTRFDGNQLDQRNSKFIEALLKYDILVIAGQAKSHCVAWTIEDLLRDIQKVDPALASKVYLLGDCTSPVVVPGISDYTPQADAAFQRFVDAGMHLVSSDDSISSWL